MSNLTAIYVRISKDSQARGLGVQRQEAQCRELAKSKGWTVTQLFSDNDISAYSGKARPGYEALCTAIAEGTVGALVVYHPDRLHRQTKELETFIPLVESAGIEIATVSGGALDLTTPAGRAVAKTIGAWAQYESEQKAKRVEAQKAQSASNGWWQGGARPYGYESERTEEGNASLTIIEDEALIIKELAERVLGGESLRLIATDLNERGIQTTRGGMWRVTTIRNTLTNGTVAGLRTHKGQIVGEGNWPAILSRATWEQCGAVLDTRARESRGRPSNHLLTGLLKCHKCDGTLWARGAKGTPRYVCVKQANNEHCGGTSINAEPLESFITQVAVTALRSLVPTVEVPIDMTATTAEIEELEARMDRLSILHFSEGQMSEREYLAARNGLETKLNDARTELANAPTVTKTFEIQDHAAFWDSYSLEEKRQALGLAIDKVVVHPGNRWTKVPDRLETHFTNGKVSGLPEAS